jgi:hypothetical protein
LAGGAAVGGLTAAYIAIPQMMDELDAIKQDETLTNKERGKAKGGAIGDAGGTIVGGAVGGAAGIAAGAAVGAAVGSVVPVLGTAVGALVGAGIGAIGMWLGSKAGRAVGEGIGEAVAKADIPKALANEINAVPAIPRGSGNPVLEGNAVMNIDVKVSDEQTRATVAIGNNNMPIKYDVVPIKYDVGSAVTARRNPL